MSTQVTVKRNNARYTANPKFIKATPVATRKVWHDSLVSGEFKQGVLAMYYSGKYCCLGVGSTNFVTVGSLYGNEIPSEQSKFAKAFNGAENATYGMGYDPYIAIRCSDGHRVSATTLNDNVRLSFKEIAKLIYPEGYKR